MRDYETLLLFIEANKAGEAEIRPIRADIEGNYRPKDGRETVGRTKLIAGYERSEVPGNVIARKSVWQDGNTHIKRLFHTPVFADGETRKKGKGFLAFSLF